MKYPSVTKILDATMDPVKRAALDAWKLRVGEAEAERIREAAFLRGHLIDANVDVWRRTGACKDPRITAHLAGYTFAHHELTVVSEAHKYQGRLDAVLQINGQSILVDFKGATKFRGRKYLTDYETQIGAYYGACVEMGIHIDSGCVCIFVDGMDKPVLHWISIDSLKFSHVHFTQRVHSYYRMKEDGQVI